MSDNGIGGEVKWDNGIRARGNCVNCMIRLCPVCQNYNWGKAANTNPLQCTLLVRSRVTKGFNHNQIAVCYRFTQRLVGGV